MHAKIKISNGFQHDLQEVTNYLSTKFVLEKNINRYIDNIIDKCNLISVTPEAYPIFWEDKTNQNNNIRTFRVKSYTVFYKYNKKNNEVELARIIYSRRKFIYILK